MIQNHTSYQNYSESAVVYAAELSSKFAMTLVHIRKQLRHNDELKKVVNNKDSITLMPTTQNVIR